MKLIKLLILAAIIGTVVYLAKEKEAKAKEAARLKKLKEKREAEKVKEAISTIGNIGIGSGLQISLGGISIGGF